MAGRFTIWTDFRVGKSETSAYLKATQRQLVMFESTASNAMATFRGVLGAQVVGRGLSFLQAGLQEVTTQFVDFDQAVTSAGARWGDSFDRGTEGFAQLSAAARATGAATEHTSAQAGNALNFMAMAGFDAATSMGLLPDIANVATAANLDFARSSDIASDALGAFGLAGGTTNEKIEGFRKIVDQATESTNTSNQKLEMWFEAIKEGGPAFTAANQEMSTLNATIGVLANSGKKGATAGFMLRNVMNRLAAPAAKGAKWIRQLRVEVKDSEGNFRNFIDILADFEKGMAGMGAVQRAKVIKEVFGEQAVAGMNILLQEGSVALKDYADSLEDSAGAAQRVADKMRTSVQGRLKKLQSAAIELGFKMVDAFGPRIEGYMERIGHWLDDANSNAGPLVDTIVQVGGAFADVAEFIVENRDHIIRLTKAWFIFKSGMVIGGGVINGLNMVNSALQVMQGNTGMATQAVGNLKTSLVGMQAMIGGVTAALTAGLALGTALWDSLEANAKKAQEVVNLAYKANQQMDPSKLKGYSDESLVRLIKLQSDIAKQEHSTFLGWDPNREEHEAAKAAAEDMLNKLHDERLRRKRLQEARANLGLQPIRFGHSANIESSGGATTTRTESVERKEVQHTLKIEDKNKQVTLVPADPGIMP